MAIPDSRKMFLACYNRSINMFIKKIKKNRSFRLTLWISYRVSLWRCDWSVSFVKSVMEVYDHFQSLMTPAESLWFDCEWGCDCESWFRKHMMGWKTYDCLQNLKPVDIGTSGLGLVCFLYSNSIHYLTILMNYRKVKLNHQKYVFLKSWES